MQLMRMFSKDAYKGSQNYLNTQKKYEILRTVIYFGISFSLFIAGWVTTKDKMNLLTVVAILGCLPASKSMVNMIMHLRYKSLSTEAASSIKPHIQTPSQSLCDLVFTSYEKNYQVGHMTVKGNTLIGYTEDPGFDEKGFSKHIDQILKNENYRKTTVKVFSDLPKYIERLDQLNVLDADETNTPDIISTLKGVSL